MSPKEERYQGFEQGPIRPPSEAYSLLIRVTRNCPWNRCAFCPVYKGASFSSRPVEHVFEDIDRVHRYIEAFRAMGRESGRAPRQMAQAALEQIEPADTQACIAAINWFTTGMRSIFLQDANSLIVRPPGLVRILEHLRRCFPQARRITSYARSHTVAHRKAADLEAIAAAGLNRIHIGLESGSDRVLERVNKGSTKVLHIQGGRKVKEAGMELSEYYMPGLGGRELSHEHALESADALNQIDPDFIRIRTLAIPNHVPLFEQYASGQFAPCTDLEVVEELALFLEALDGITSVLKSDHILNLLGDLEGRLPEDKAKMLEILEDFLALEPKERALYQVGRRMGVFNSLRDLADTGRRAAAEETCRTYGVTPGNVDAMIRDIMKRFI